HHHHGAGRVLPARMRVLEPLRYGGGPGVVPTTGVSGGGVDPGKVQAEKLVDAMEQPVVSEWRLGSPVDAERDATTPVGVVVDDDGGDCGSAREDEVEPRVGPRVG